MWLSWELTSFRQRGRSYSLEKSAVGTWQEQHLLVLQQGPGRDVIQGVQSPRQQGNICRAILHIHEVENWTLVHLFITDTCLIGLKRDCLILNLCLQVDYAKTRPCPQLPLAIYYWDGVQIPLAIFCLCQNCRTFHFSPVLSDCKQKLELLLSTVLEQSPTVRVPGCQMSCWLRGAQQGQFP